SLTPPPTPALHTLPYTTLFRSPVAAAPARARTTPPSRVEPVGVRQDYIVQAESVEVARSAVARVGGVVTGDLSIIRAVGAALDRSEEHTSELQSLRHLVCRLLL